VEEAAEAEEEAEEAAVAAVVEDAGDKAPVHEVKTNEIKTKYYDFIEICTDRFCDYQLLLVRFRFARRNTIESGCNFGGAANAKTIRHSQTGGRRPCSGGGEF
jgi:hypothetical protein